MNKITKIIIGIAVIVIAIIVIFGIVKRSEKTDSPENLKIGFIGPLTGENAAIGEGIRNAISLAAAEKNIEVIYEDDQFDGVKGVTAYHKLREIDQVDAIINTTPAVIDAITSLLADDPMVVIQIAEPESSDDDTIFQIMPSGAILYAVLGEMMKEKYPSFGFVYQQGATFEKAKNHFTRYFSDENHIVKEYQIDESKDYRSIVAKLKNDKVAAYTVIATPSVGAQFIKQMTEQQTGAVLVCNADIEITISEYLKVLPTSLFEGCISTIFVARMDPVFKENYKQQFTINPGFATDYGFDAVSVLIETYHNDLNKWVRALKEIKSKGVSGVVVFDENGVRIPEIETHVFKDGKFISQVE